ncbi:hypothetical protein Cs7R123_32040 [Catellatospora sp. TT07R-123]|uniref:hypothetical protein n=1 Tax=Catellatospora sp. TT07R-123 TaxID=2733863 RepID=UPI001B11E6EF|nr:hypothetical protein [Catellatospora sp. TT07R-123]GHJ45862.1 hypothetical protein Cs7R123_32040 [Catellatospora sp. TT07R-123]
MSAIELPVEHIDAMLSAALAYTPTGPLRWTWPPIDAASDRGQWTSAKLQRQATERRRELTAATAGQVGAMLLATNRDSVNHRYDETEIEPPYLFTRVPGDPDPVVVLKAVDCYEYQSCEHPGWRDSQAREFCDALRALAISRLPGYRRAPWLISEPDVFTNAASTS